MSVSDLPGHWAEAVLQDWVQKGLINGYEDGTFRPDRPISRAELVVLANKAFHLPKGDGSSFHDIHKEDWYYEDVRKASAAGYITGYEDGSFLPGRTISRQEIAVIVSRLLKLAESKASSAYTDWASVPDWSKGAIEAVSARNIMNGYPDQSFGPAKDASRAEAVMILDRAAKYQTDHPPVTKSYDQGGTFGPETGTETIAGDVVVNAPGVTLRNLAVTGNLLLAEGIGEGDVFLQHVSVQGLVNVRGGGSNSVHFTDSSIGRVVVNKKGSQVRIVVEGKTEVKEVNVQSDVKLINRASGGSGISIVTLDGEAPEGLKVELSGQFDSLVVNTPGVTVDLGKDAAVGTLTVNAAAKVTGEGTIERAIIKAAGVSIEPKPNDVKLENGVTANVAGQVVKSEAPAGGFGGIGSGTGTNAGTGVDNGGSGTGTNAGTGGDNGGGGAGTETGTGGNNGGSGAGTDTGAGGNNGGSGAGTETGAGGDNGGGGTGTDTGTGGDNGGSGGETGGGSDTGNGTQTSAITVDVLFPEALTVKWGTSVELKSPPVAGTNVWFAPSTTAVFAESSSMTLLTGDGTAKSIQAPSNEGSYNLFIVDAVGTVSLPSKAVLTVRKTPPSGQSTVFSANQTVKPGATVTLNDAPASGVTAWFAPDGTSEFTEGPQATKLAGNGSSRTIKAPAGELSYKLYLVDSVGNASPASISVLTVDGTAPNSQDNYFGSDQFVKGGTAITLAQAPAIGETVWFAASGTTSFVQGATSTSLTGDNAAATISAPQVEGDYRLFVMDQAGNISAPSGHTLHVDNTSPANQDTVFAGSQTVSPGAAVVITLVPGSGVTAWFAPAVTEPDASAFQTGPSMTKSDANGIITAPTISASYKLFLIDAAGNVSAPSSATLTVQ